MIRLPLLLALLLPSLVFAADPPKPTVVAAGLQNIYSLCVSPDGRVFVGRTIKDVRGIFEVKDGQETLVTEAYDAHDKLVAFQRWLFVSHKGEVHRVEIATGKSEVWLPKDDCPKGVNGLAVDEAGTLYVQGSVGELVRVATKPAGKGQPPVRGATTKVGTLAGNGLVMDGKNHLLTFDSDSTKDKLPLKWLPLDGQNTPATVVAEVSAKGVGLSGITADAHGRIFVLAKGEIWGLPRPGELFVKVADVSDGVYGIACQPLTGQILIADQREKALLAIPAVIPGWEVDESPLPVELVPAFDSITWTGWDDGSGSGKVNTFRPIVITHAGDGSGRTFVATQHGVIHTVVKGAKESKVFLDLQNKVLYKDTENEQGLLGLAFHPKFKTNGEFYLFYTDKAKKQENVLSRFKVKKDDSTQADPASEQELLRVSHKFWNHDGGTLAFGPDGYLYVVLGDGGSANDPDDHGQTTDALLGKILRLDVDAKGEKTAYAIPKDNPFVGNAKYRPEVFALGVRNPWRMSFDRKTGQGWFGDVGQNLWEEINLLEKGANYGWRRREGLHPFGVDGSGPDKKYTDPVWEYSHDVGKSITAGHVYRGKAVPALDGHFLYADYVSKKVWGLKYDDKTKRVTANRPIPTTGEAWMSFGEDEAGEAYIMTYSTKGKGIFTFKAK